MSKSNHKQYALYYVTNEDEKPLWTGSRKELAEYLKVTEKTIVFYHSPAWIKRNKTGYRVYDIEYEGDDTK